ncbi:flagellar hook-length control protein FliK [Novosphingobium gossypii]|uniref:flagellar hook-length control protein FliK n=1 Tax=Novosphingobium gossypii TaxID=1604774 RepID=UPI003D1E1AE3
MPVSVTPLIPTIAPAGVPSGVQAPAAQGDPGAFMAALAAVGGAGAPMGMEASIGGGPVPVQGTTGSALAPAPQADDAAPGPSVETAPGGVAADSPSPAPAPLTPAVPAPVEPIPDGKPVAEQAPVPQGAPPARSKPSPLVPPASQLPGEARTTAIAGATTPRMAEAATPLDVPAAPIDDAPNGVPAPMPLSTSQAAGQTAEQSFPVTPDAPAQEPASAAPGAAAIPIQTALRPDGSAPRTQSIAQAVGKGGQEAGRVHRRKAASPAVPRVAVPVAQEGAAVQTTPLAMPPGVSHAASPALPASVAPKEAERVQTSATGHVISDGPTPSTPDLSAPEPRVPAPLFTQTLDIAAARHGALPYETAPTGHGADGQDAIVSMRPGSFGTDVGVAIARALDNGPDGARDALLIRLDPRHMGRIDVKMSFDDDGTLRAVVSADQPVALDMLRRESTHLDRALADAGVRADAQSLRFDGSGSLGSGAGGQQRHGGRPQMPAAQPGAGEFSGTLDGAQPILRSLRGSGHVDLMA